MGRGAFLTWTAPPPRDSWSAPFLIRSIPYQNVKAVHALARARCRLFARLARDRGRQGPPRDDRV